MRNDNVKPDWRYIAIDETQHWCDAEIVEACKRLFGIYVFDARSYVYCCEITPSFELHFLRNESLEVPEEQSERVYDALTEAGAGGDDVHYRHVRSIDVGSCKQVGYEPEPDDDRDARAMVDDVLRYACEAYEDVPLLIKSNFPRTWELFVEVER